MWIVQSVDQIGQIPMTCRRLGGAIWQLQGNIAGHQLHPFKILDLHFVKCDWSKSFVLLFPKTIISEPALNTLIILTTSSSFISMVPNVTFLILNGVVGHKFRTLPRFLGNISKLKTLDMLKRCNILFFACPGFSSASSLSSSASLSPASWSRWDNSNFLKEKSCSNFCLT